MGAVMEETMLPLSRLERAVLDKLLAGEGPVAGALRRQLLAARVAKRDLTGVGFFSTLVVPADEAAAPTAKAGPVGDVEATIEGLEHGAGFLLWIKAGRLEALEGFSYDEPWPADADRFELRYHKEPRTPIFDGG